MSCTEDGSSIVLSRLESLIVEIIHSVSGVLEVGKKNVGSEMFKCWTSPTIYDTNAVDEMSNATYSIPTMPQRLGRSLCTIVHVSAIASLCRSQSQRRVVRVITVARRKGRQIIDASLCTVD
jgi:hypothetical protein